MVKFLIVGGGVNGIAILLFSALILIGTIPEVAQIIVGLIAILVSHHLNRMWTFHGTSNYIVSLIKFSILNVLVIIGQIIVMFIFFRKLGVHPIVVQTIAIICFAALTFTINKLLIFRK